MREFDKNAHQASSDLPEASVPVSIQLKLNPPSNLLRSMVLPFLGYLFIKKYYLMVVPCCAVDYSDDSTSIVLKLEHGLQEGLN